MPCVKTHDRKFNWNLENYSLKSSHQNITKKNHNLHYEEFNLRTVKREDIIIPKKRIKIKIVNISEIFYLAH